MVQFRPDPGGIHSPVPLLTGDAGSSAGDGQAETGFIGRGRELTILRGRLEAAWRGEGGVAVIVGEPGIGKTRLAQAIAAEAHAAGGRVLWGRAYEGDWSPPYAPWAEALGDYLRDAPPERLRADLQRLGPGAASLAQVLPTVRDAADVQPTAALGPEEERFRFYDAVAGLLQSAAGEHPLVVVLDDLQWADRGSLGLLGFLLRVVPRTRLLIVATMRADDLDQGERRAGLTELLAALHREPGFVRLPLSGLDEAEVTDVVASEVARTVNPALGRAIHGETGGNPFYVQEVVRHLLDEGALVERDGVWTAAGSFRELGVPEGVRQVVNRRLARLTERTHALLGFASVFSGGADARVLQVLTGLDEEALLDAIDEALAAGLIRSVADRAETYDFAHAIVRHALYEERSPSRNVRLHRQVAEALEQVYGGLPAQLGAHAAELAAQFHASSSLTGAERGVPYALAAANLARAGYDRDGAVGFLRMARDLVAESEPGTRADILARLAVAEADALALEDAARTTDEAFAAFGAAATATATIAAFLQDVSLALKSGGAGAGVWLPLVERGLALCGGERDLAWARLNLIMDPIEPVLDAPLKAGLWRGFDPEAVRTARERGSEDDQARTYESFDPRTLEETRALVRLGRTWRQPTAILRALTVAANDLQYRHGAFAEALEIWQEQRVLSERSGATSWQANALTQLTFLHLALGDFARARKTERQANALQTRLGPYRESETLAIEMATGFAWYLGGDWPAIARNWTTLVTVAPGAPGLAVGDAHDFSLLAGPLYAAMAALAHVEAGTADEARQLLRDLLPLLTLFGPEHQQNQNGAVAFAAAAAWRLEAAEHASSLRRMAQALLAAGIGDYPQTSLHLTVARTSALRGDTIEATAAFERARASLDASGQRPLRAIADYDEAVFLTRSKGADLGRAQQLLEDALERFADQGMSAWAARAEAARATLGPAGARSHFPAGLTEREVDVIRLVGRGYSDRQISEELFISTRTVNAHLRNMFAKANVNNRTELSVWASANGLLDAGSDGGQRS
jgi:DNA-binding CsgD family transcriptional regulator